MISRQQSTATTSVQHVLEQRSAHEREILSMRAQLDQVNDTSEAETLQKEVEELRARIQLVDGSKDLSRVKSELEAMKEREAAAEHMIRRREVEANLIEMMRAEIAQTKTEANQVRQGRAQELHKVAGLANSTPEEMEQLLQLQSQLQKEQADKQEMQAQLQQLKGEAEWLRGCHAGTHEQADGKTKTRSQRRGKKKRK
eukprot:TRINITY_DN8434_c0_g1_i2.p1 TRINITY_DN8434_c0_g1~~TRINITY_DN8434_c0_g1_i2.p1  ORF type:complete len:199 (+),score=82.17 TRINITY_DN8434_c0_g1_i2:257-853(+)